MPRQQLHPSIEVVTAKKLMLLLPLSPPPGNLPAATTMPECKEDTKFYVAFGAGFHKTSLPSKSSKISVLEAK
jgi:hypothetical protein